MATSRYLGFECLAERTIALAQQAKLRGPGSRLRSAAAARGWRRCWRPAWRAASASSPTWARPTRMPPPPRWRAVARKPRPARDADRRRHRRRRAGRIAAAPASADGTAGGNRRLARRRGSSRPTPISASAPIVAALAAGADVVITGRVADPALFMAPLVHEFGWADGRLGRAGTGAPSSAICWNAPARSPAGISPIPATRTFADLARLGFPLAEVRADGDAVHHQGRRLGRRGVACRPARSSCSTSCTTRRAIYQPDVIADFSAVRLAADGADRVRGDGRGRHAAPGHAEGVGRLSRQFRRRGPDLLRRRRRAGARAAGARDRARAAAR